MRRNGFTLIEVLMVVGILAIFATMAMPQYRKTFERSYWNTAQDILRTIYAGEQVYFSVNDAYFDVIEGNPNSWRTIYMDNPSVANIPVVYSVTVNPGPPSTFTAIARRTALQFLLVTQASGVPTGSWTQP